MAPAGMMLAVPLGPCSSPSPYLTDRGFKMILQLTPQWQNINTLTSVAAGTEMLVQSQSSGEIYLKESATAPANTSFDGIIVKPGDHWTIATGSLAVWAKSEYQTAQIFAEV